MTSQIKKFIPKLLINYGKHLPDAVIANVRYGFPSKKMTVIGVTGTDGKTTTVNMIYEILKASGKKVSMISTINAVIGRSSFDTGFHVTNPGRQDLQYLLKKAVEEGSEIMILETTSQGLVQFRNWGVDFAIGVITNITPEHLDYHKTFKNYRNAKAKLIKLAKVAILNKDDPNFSYLKKFAKGKTISYGLESGADVSLKDLPLTLKLPGEFNKQNALAAAAAAMQLGVSKETIIKSLNGFGNLSGRMEDIPNSKGIKIIIDFAHTPNALENALKTLRQLSKGRIISVFGAASERDTNKRPIMGEISAELSDITVLTDEDPRFESGMKIIDQIAKGALDKGAKLNINLFEIPDRQEAINKAISLAKKGDIIGIFGKGHERSMNYRGVEKTWSDKEAVERALGE